MPYSDSASVSVSINLMGVWIHFPGNEESSSANFIYGSNARSTSMNFLGSGTFYAGRVDPIFDYGEHESRRISVSIVVPHGPDYRTNLDTLEAFAQSRTAVWFRDNRGRCVYGVIEDYSTSDEASGSVVSFNISKAHRDIVTVVS